MVATTTYYDEHVRAWLIAKWNMDMSNPFMRAHMEYEMELQRIVICE